MKNILIPILIFFLMTSGYSQEFTETITREFSFEKKSSDNAIMVANINGDVKVTGYSGDKILLEVKRSIRAKTSERLERGKQELQLGVIDLADSIILYVQEGCNQFNRNVNRKNTNGSKNNWGYNWQCNNNNCRSEYDYTMDFTLKVPSSINLQVSTINDGDITVENVTGAVRADNINGSIKLTNLTREAVASTINGDVDVEYDKNPQKECRFYSLNGDINAWFQKGLAADLSFESFNGSFYTNIDQIAALPAKVEKAVDNKNVKFKVAGNRYQVGQGGALLDFETFNGNVYLKER